MEEWRDVVDYEGLYEVSSEGRVRTVERKYIDKQGYKKKTKQIILKTTLHRGYVYVSLNKEGKRSTKRVHRLVALAFIKNKCGGKEVNHIDSNKQNNHISNLEWSDRSRNMSHYYRSLRRKKLKEQGYI